jgi:hypothetical protein
MAVGCAVVGSRKKNVGCSVGTELAGNPVDGFDVGFLVGVEVRATGAIGRGTGALVAAGLRVGLREVGEEGLGEIVGLMAVGCAVVGSR